MSNGLCDRGDGKKAIWLNSSGVMFCGRHFREFVRREYGWRVAQQPGLTAVKEDGWERL